MRSKITSAQLTKLHTLLSKSGLTDHKAELVSHFSNGRTSSSKELTGDEAFNLIMHLDENAASAELEKEKRDRMVKKLFALAYEMGFDIPKEDQSGMDRKALCKKNLQAWIMSKHCSVNKPLNELTTHEVWKVLGQFEQVNKHFKKEYQRNG